MFTILALVVIISLAKTSQNIYSYEAMREVHKLDDQKKYQEAISKLEKIIRDNPGDEEAFHFLGQLKKKLTEEKYKHHHDKGIDLLNKGKWSLAIREFESALRHKPSDQAASTYLKKAKFEKYKSDGIAQLTEGYFELAKDNLERALQLNYDADIEKWLDFIKKLQNSESFLKENKYDLAINSINKALLIKPNNKYAMKLKERILKGKNNYLHLKTFQEYDLHYNIGMKYLSEGKWSLAVREFESALRQKPSDQAASTYLKKAKFEKYKSEGLKQIEEGNFVLAKDSLEKALRLNYDANIEKWLDFIKKLQNSENHLKEKKYDLAINSINKALLIKPNNKHAIKLKEHVIDEQIDHAIKIAHINLNKQQISEKNKTQLNPKHQKSKDKAIKPGFIALVIVLISGGLVCIIVIRKWTDYNTKYKLWKEKKVIGKFLALNVNNNKALIENEQRKLKDKVSRLSEEYEIKEPFVEQMNMLVEKKLHKDLDFVILSHKVLDDFYDKEISKRKLDPEQKKELLVDFKKIIEQKI